jgi:hypothetical protein
MVMDRFMLIVFSTIFSIGTILILTRSPYLIDTTEPLKLQFATKPLSGDTFEPELRNFTFPEML